MLAAPVASATLATLTLSSEYYDWNDNNYNYC